MFEATRRLNYRLFCAVNSGIPNRGAEFVHNEGAGVSESKSRSSGDDAAGIQSPAPGHTSVPRVIAPDRTSDSICWVLTGPTLDPCCA